MTTVADILKTKAEPAVHTIAPVASVYEAVHARAAAPHLDCPLAGQ